MKILFEQLVYALNITLMHFSNKVSYKMQNLCNEYNQP